LWKNQGLRLTLSGDVISGGLRGAGASIENTTIKLHFNRILGGREELIIGLDTTYGKRE
jgi:hypothetical protein